MADELIIEGDSKVENPRIKELSNKVKSIAEERDAAAEAKKLAEDRATAAEKERDFFSSFSDIAVQYPNAQEHKDAIKAKVLAGYSVEDAAVSVLAKEGKLTAKVNLEDRVSAAGGSAATNIAGDKKKPSEMSQAERLDALKAAEAAGEIGLH